MGSPVGPKSTLCTMTGIGRVGRCILASMPLVSGVLLTCGDVEMNPGPISTGPGGNRKKQTGVTAIQIEDLERRIDQDGREWLLPPPVAVTNRNNPPELQEHRNAELQSNNGRNDTNGQLHPVDQDGSESDSRYSDESDVGLQSKIQIPEITW